MSLPEGSDRGVVEIPLDESQLNNTAYNIVYRTRRALRASDIFAEAVSATYNPVPDISKDVKTDPRVLNSLYNGNRQVDARLPKIPIRVPTPEGGAFQYSYYFYRDPRKRQTWEFVNLSQFGPHESWPSKKISVISRHGAFRKTFGHVVYYSARPAERFINSIQATENAVGLIAQFVHLVRPDIDPEMYSKVLTN